MTLDLEAIKARCEAATAGPMTEQIVELSWSTEENPQYGYWINDSDGDAFAHVWSEADMKYVSHARQDISALLAEVERLRADLESEEKWAKEYFDAKEKAEAEVERLRAALEKIANDDPFVKNTWWVGTINEMRSIAAEALKGGEE